MFVQPNLAITDHRAGEKRIRPASEDIMTDDVSIALNDSSRPRRSINNDSTNGIVAMEQFEPITAVESFSQPPNEITQSQDSLQQWIHHASTQSESIHAQLMRAREVVQNYYKDNIAQHEQNVDANLMNELNEERAKLCQMVVVSCREIEVLRTQLIQQASNATMNENEKQELISSTQRVFGEAEAARQKYVQLESMFYNVANHILILQQERDNTVQENIQLQASLRALDFYGTQEVAGVTSQLEQQTAELSSIRAEM